MTFRPLAVAAACLILSACGANPAREAIRAGSGNGSAREAGQAQARNFLEVLARVEPVAEADCRQYNPGANCDFLFLVDDRPGMPPNAFQTLDASGRPILAFTISLISAVQNGDELAFVMSHEAAHHIAGHLDRMDRNALVGAAVFGQIASAAVGATADSIREAQMIGAEVGARSYSKEFELEADRLGTLVAIQAGFDPVRGTEFFLRLPDPGDRFMGTHPSNAERIAAVRAAAAGL